MKKFGIIALTLVLTFALSACRRGDDKETTIPPETASRATTVPTTIDTMPIIDPTIGTNIPDPTVDSNSTEGMTDGMTDGTVTGSTGDTTPSARNGIMFSE